MKDLLEGTDWDSQPDYKHVEQELRRIANEWQKVKDVEQGAGQKQWNKLCKHRTSIYEKLDVVYDANIALKQQLIDQAEKLMDSDTKEQALNTLQQLQMRWKQVGVTRRKQDQAAWKKFKSVTDAVYEKIQGVRNARRAEEDEQLNGYRNVIKQIRELAKKAKDLSASDSEFDRLEAEYGQLPELPKGLPEKLVEGIASDLKRAKDEYVSARDRIKASLKTNEWKSLEKKARLCTELEALPASADDEDIEEIQAAIAAIQMTDKTLLTRFDQRLAVAVKSDQSRRDANETRRLICIELEILAGEESPKDDKTLRMTMQLERMKIAGIGRAPTEKGDMVKQLRIDWLCSPGGEPEVQKLLDKRFSKIVKTF